MVLAEKVGFEPTVPCGTPDFECGMLTMHYAGTRMGIGSMGMHTVRQIRRLHVFGQKIPNTENHFVGPTQMVYFTPAGALCASS